MNESMPFCDYLDEFNKILVDLTNIDVQVDDEHQALILFNNFVNSMLYIRDTVSLGEVKFALNSMELRTRLNGKGSDNQANSLFVTGSENFSNFRGRSNEWDLVEGKLRG